jgi:hypothetical protein
MAHRGILGFRVDAFASPRNDEGSLPQTRSPILTIFWHCGSWHFSLKTGAGERASGNQPSMVLAEDGLPKGLAMLIRSENDGIYGKAAIAAGPDAIPAASLPTRLLGGLLLLIGP